MSKKLNLINDILYRDNRPWKMENYSEPKFKQLLIGIKTVQPKLPPLYNIEFEKPITFKRKYFLKLIDTDAAAFLNEIHTAVKRSQSINHKKFQVYPALNKTLKDLLLATNQIITERELQEDKFKPVQGKIPKGNIADEAFIFHYLKHQLIRLYLEISESYPDYRKSENLEIEDLYATFFSEIAPDPVVIIPTLESETETVSESNDQQEEVIEIESFKYKEFDTEPDKLTDLCDSLKLNKFIDNNTTTPQFKKVFSGKEITSPVIWTGNASELYYFIHTLYNTHKVLEDMKQRQWKVACKCFIKSDGSEFEPTKVKNLKRPALTGDKLDKAIQHVL
jgi:hypothetical protein